MSESAINVCRIDRSINGFCYQMMFGHKDAEGGFSVMTEMKMELLPQGRIPPLESVIDFESELGQTMIDELWRAGFRPSLAPVGEGRTQAMTEHLKDLRVLLGKQMKVTL